jgi:hypothetical protein
MISTTDLLKQSKEIRQQNLDKKSEHLKNEILNIQSQKLELQNCKTA